MRDTKVIQGLSNADYHADPSISKSGLDLINKSPLHYWDRYLNEDKPKYVPNEAFNVGSLLHNMILEPEQFDEEFIVTPADLNRRTKAGREEYQALLDTGKIVITQDDYKLCQRMTSAISQHRKASRYLATSGHSELSLFWKDKDTGVDCRCRPDFMTEDGYIVDLKTSLTASQRGFSRKAIWDFRYHVQAAFYTEGYLACYGELPKGFIFVAVEKTSPFSIGVFNVPVDTYKAGEELVRKNLATYKWCLDNNVWPSYNNDEEMELKV